MHDSIIHGIHKLTIRPATCPSDCLAKHSYNEAKCKSQLDALYECCKRFYERNGDEATSASCPKANLLRFKMKQRTEAAGSERP